MELSNEQVIALFQSIAKLDAKVDALSIPGAICGVHAERLDEFGRRMDSVEEEYSSKIAALELQAGKQNVIAATIGAVAAAIVLALKYLVGRGST